MEEDSRVPDDPIGSELVREDASFADLVTEFLAGIGERVRAMEVAVRGADFESLRVSAHQLKGSGGGYGYPILTERSAELERRARNHEVDACVQLIEELKSICSRLVVDPAKNE